MTNTIKIYAGGKLIQVVKRQPTKVMPVTKLRRNGVGTNQYMVKRRVRRTGRSGTLGKTLVWSAIFMLAFGIFIYGAKSIWAYEIDPSIKSINSKIEYWQKVEIELINPVTESETVFATPSAMVEVNQLKEERVEKLREYLEKQKSPLADHADYIVSMADEHDIPWTLITAISGKESTYGKHIRSGSFNAWGIMSWDAAGNRSIRSFGSWQAGIEYATRLIAKSYRTNMVESIQKKYCPDYECSKTWVADVTAFQAAINK